ncbi:MAG: ATP-dependent protease ATPase subunit HslU [Candidatus Marinimicrobia bacterium]|jgi:ATP-dependent HslUV protease ATP-binding subunit HslU|nr:ATP-dependent protease ATPase subunit HslU [Candidatus Neomarinimicrobiota bacterium]MBT3945312.1 ATP-dependent protease ATPase subunit HslU [Candidatus Neomarinimicrobiota bacterium]MBT4155647.1 ATP-dependent protease ATPase subunit HslU [Candidatus Neomarinimicrobiota bacterium]MBT4554459.1 ATP-dependent protease ATPase subunit HslU [Candidatus Neomarinimicrobiota bacterium]MBT4752055.1 ATP-dependent protease ATPase subunit HslU [Candidatus Neomarinimicrobiota bacterium]|tara:strand:- start:3326 stop:4666 length:1341 start_codon:yes stop_codon:yes gene_type:complete
MKQLTPKQIVKELDRYIVGQKKAKKAVAIALRNRWRRQQVEGKLRDEIMPNNIIMIGSTGVGKTEIARRLASLSNAPFIKVEASKFTEVGYVGRDVESMVRDLMDTAISMVEREKEDEVVEMAELLANERILDILFPDDHKNDTKQSKELKERHARTRGKIRKKMEKGEFENKMIDVEVSDDPIVGMQVFGPMGMEDIGMNIKDMISGQLPKNKRTKKMAVSEAREVLLESEAAKLIDHEEVIRIARERTENTGIIFLDEIDKVVGSVGGVGPDVSREGVQRDLLPIVEGSNVSTKYGIVATDHILFIAAGAFHVSTPSDMIPELQGRFPIRVELDKLTKEDFVKILTHPRSALIKQYKALLGAENVELEFNDAAIKAVAEFASEVNSKMENIGARRLHTIMTTLLEDHLFEQPKRGNKKIKITATIVKESLKDIVEDPDLSRYIL